MWTEVVVTDLRSVNPNEAHNQGLSSCFWQTTFDVSTRSLSHQLPTRFLDLPTISITTLRVKHQQFYSPQNFTSTPVLLPSSTQSLSFALSAWAVFRPAPQPRALPLLRTHSTSYPVSRDPLKLATILIISLSLIHHGRLPWLWVAGR